MGGGGGGGGGFVPRTQEQMNIVPLALDATVGVASGVAAAVAVSPFLMCVDRAVGRALFTASPLNTS